MGLNGDPERLGGKHAHYAVLVGYVKWQGEVVLLAKHPWNLRALHIWTWNNFRDSSLNMETTTFYGNSRNTTITTPDMDLIPKSVFTDGFELPRPARSR